MLGVTHSPRDSQTQYSEKNAEELIGSFHTDGMWKWWYVRYVW